VELGILDVVHARLRQHVVVHREGQPGRRAFRRSALALQHAFGHRVDERRIEADSRDALVGEVARAVMGKAGRGRIVFFSLSGSRQHLFDMARADSVAGTQRLALADV
jgi:hypothetical protein